MPPLVDFDDQQEECHPRDRTEIPIHRTSNTESSACRKEKEEPSPIGRGVEHRHWHGLLFLVHVLIVRNLFWLLACIITKTASLLLFPILWMGKCFAFLYQQQQQQQQQKSTKSDSSCSSSILVPVFVRDTTVLCRYASVSRPPTVTTTVSFSAGDVGLFSILMIVGVLIAGWHEYYSGSTISNDFRHHTLLALAADPIMFYYDTINNNDVAAALHDPKQSDNDTERGLIWTEMQHEKEQGIFNIWHSNLSSQDTALMLDHIVLSVVTDKHPPREEQSQLSYSEARVILPPPPPRVENQVAAKAPHKDMIISVTDAEKAVSSQRQTRDNNNNNNSADASLVPIMRQRPFILSWWSHSLHRLLSRWKEANKNETKITTQERRSSMAVAVTKKIPGQCLFRMARKIWRLFQKIVAPWRHWEHKQ